MVALRYKKFGYTVMKLCAISSYFCAYAEITQIKEEDNYLGETWDIITLSSHGNVSPSPISNIIKPELLSNHACLSTLPILDMTEDRQKMLDTFKDKYDEIKCSVYCLNINKNCYRFYTVIEDIYINNKQHKENEEVKKDTDLEIKW